MAGVGALQKKAENIENIRARSKLLIDGIKNHNSIDKAVHASLVGQRAFAALELPHTKIKSIALNTLKSLADEIFKDSDSDGKTGFAYIDALRITLRQKLSAAAATRTVEAKAQREENKINKFEAKCAATEAHSVKRDKAYLSLYTSINGLIKSGDLQSEAQERLYRILENHRVAFSGLFEPDIVDATGKKAKVTKLRRQDGPK
jgi:hypothetical protein